MHLPFAPMIVASLLLIWAPPDEPNERTQCVQPSIYLPSYLLPTYLEWLSCPESEMPGEEPDSSIRLPLPQAATTDNANSQPAGEF